MLLLALDTATAAVTVALHDGAAVVAERTALDARRHAELLVPSVQDMLAAAGADRRDITDVAVGVGPGPFTSLRVGLVTARVLGLALSVPVVGVCSLDALAEEARAAPELLGGPGLLGDTEILVATDARRREVYWARYASVAAGESPRRIDGPHVGAPSSVPRQGLPVIGRGAALYADLLGGCEGPLEVSASALATLAVRELAAGHRAGTGALLAPAPLYLRRPDAVAPGVRKRVLPGPAR